MLTAERIKAKAKELGFDLCGIAPADNFPELGFLSEWLERGYAGEMAYMSRSADRRADVRNVVSGARTVIVTGTIYNSDKVGLKPDPTGNSGRDQVSPQCPLGEHQRWGSPSGGPESGPASAGPFDPRRANIARYAMGDDYHDVLKTRLDALLEWMRAQTCEQFDARAYVDTGPVQERVYAQYAGLGWIGKNTCLINAEHGSWLFLAEIITTLDFEQDTQALEQCGSCRRCLSLFRHRAKPRRFGRTAGCGAQRGRRFAGRFAAHEIPFGGPGGVSEEASVRPRAQANLAIGCVARKALQDAVPVFEATRAAD